MLDAARDRRHQWAITGIFPEGILAPRSDSHPVGQRGFIVWGLMRRRIELGLLYSRSGSYALISEACRTGALAAIAMVNADPDLDLSFVPVERDPGGNVDLYAPLCDDILRQTSARHVIGCVTSWSRKDVIPTLENAGGTLWYAVPYEGFEASDHVVYTHACPNQHLLPLLDWAHPTYGRRAFLTGSNYIWGWEMNRLARETIVAAGGQVLGERYLPIGSRDVGRMIEEIRATAPDFILNSLIGPSSYAFLAAYRDMARADARFTPEACPVLSCNMTECEMPAMGDESEGLIAAGPYFRGAMTEAGDAGPFGSSHEAAAFAAVRELARLLDGRPGAERLSLAHLLDHGAPGIIDRQTHHTTLPVLIAQVRKGRFEVIERRPAVAGDPYLTHPRSTGRAPSLRVVS
jgi:ABC-type branched-subunit amino acid transport system substrate-binding protein